DGGLHRGARRCARGTRPGTVDACRHPLECRMAVLAPFRALRPPPPAVARVAAVPYDVVNADEARALAAGNPLSFLHVSRAEIDCPRDVDPYNETVYAKAVENFDRLKREAPLIVDD